MIDKLYNRYVCQYVVKSVGDIEKPRSCPSRAGISLVEDNVGGARL